MTRNTTTGTPRETLELEPLEGEKKAVPAPAQPEGAAQFHANTRSGGERRQSVDRREMIRFEDDRRAKKDRRPRRTWESGKNL
jgi:hypothetical protein